LFANIGSIGWCLWLVIDTICSDLVRGIDFGWNGGKLKFFSWRSTVDCEWLTGEKATLPYLSYCVALPRTLLVLPSYSVRTSPTPLYFFVLPILPCASFLIPSYSLVLPSYSLRTSKNFWSTRVSLFPSWNDSMDDPILNFQKKFLVRFGREFSRVSRRIGLDFSVIVEGNMGVTFSLIITGFFILMQMRMFVNFLLN